MDHTAQIDQALRHASESGGIPGVVAIAGNSRDVDLPRALSANATCRNNSR